MRVDEHTTTVDHVPVFYRSASEAERIPVLYLHEALTSSDDFLPLLERSGGIAPDLIGFGRSSKGGHLDYTPEGLADFLDRFVDHLGLERVRLVGHGWGGALGLLLAERRPGLVTRLVLIDAVPLLEGFAWHGPARLWRRPVVGELVMGSTPRWLLDRELRKASTAPETWSSARLSAIWEQFDQGTQRAILRLHRAADESRLVELGGGLGSLTIPSLVVWGEADPWFEPRFADAYASRLPDARAEHVADAGHWPWLDQPGLADRVIEFLE